MIKNYVSILLFCVTAFSFGQVTLVKDINVGDGNSNPRNPYVFNGSIFFNADDSSGINTGGADLGQELWISDGTDAGTVLVKDIRVGSSNSSPNFFFELNGVLYFSANEGSGLRIFQTDGTEAGTVSTNNTFSNLQPIVIGSKAYMTATTLGNVFYEFDGTTFQEVPDTGAGTATPLGGEYIQYDGNTIFLYMDYSTDSGTVGRELYAYDITAQSYSLIKDVEPGTDNSGISNFTKIGSTVYFEAESMLWQTDGTDAGTFAVAAAMNANIDNVRSFFGWFGDLYFEGDDGSGDQLWKYDPVADTVTNLSNISGANNNHDPGDYVSYDGWLYYSGEDATDSEPHLFRTDGTIIEQLDNTIVDVDDIVLYNDVLYFEGEDEVVDTGNELFSFDPASLSITSVGFDADIRVYPNPSTDYIKINHNLNNALNYQVIDINGRLIQEGEVVDNTINHNLDNGMYFLKIYADSKFVKTQKIIVR